MNVMFDKKIKEVMTSPGESVSPDASVREAAQKMRDSDIGLIVVCENSKPTGVVTDRDVAIRCAALGGDPSKCRISEIMSRAVVTVSEDSDLKDAERLMEERQVRRLVVVDGSGGLRGVVSLKDVVEQDARMTARIVEKVTQPAAGVGH